MRCVGPGHVRLRHRPPLRWLLLAVAVALSWFAIDTAIRLEFAGAPVLAAALGLLLLVGGFIAVRWFEMIEISPAGVTWTRRGRLGFGVICRKYPRGAVEAVRIRATVLRATAPHGSVPRVCHTVGLACHAPLPSAVLLYRGRRETQARDRAVALCRAASLPLLDATGDADELCDVAALGGPPVTRLARPDTAPPKGVVLAPDPVHGDIVTLARWFGLTVTLSLVDDELRIDWRWCGVPLRSRRLAVATIERVRLQQDQRQAGPEQSSHLQAGVAVRAGRRTIAFGGWLTQPARSWLRAWLESRIWPQLPTELASVPVAGAALAATL